MTESKQLIEFYTNIYDEDLRLFRHRTEFITTTYVLDKYVEIGSRILDVGAGTGLYSLYYANKGCSVNAIDLVPKNIEKMNSKIKTSQNLSVVGAVGDVRDLSRFSKNSFDVVLCLGPICHLKGNSIDSCIQESLRVLKNGGVFAASYINKYQGYQYDKYKKIFTFHTPENINRRFRKYGMTFVDNVPTDGQPFAELTNSLEIYKDDLQKSHAWLESHRVSV